MRASVLVDRTTIESSAAATINGIATRNSRPASTLTGWAPPVWVNLDFSFALLHAERLTRILADEAVAEALLAQARRHPERRPWLERYLERAEPRVRFLLDEITTTGKRLLAELAAPLDTREAAE